MCVYTCVCIHVYACTPGAHAYWGSGDQEGAGVWLVSDFPSVPYRSEKPGCSWDSQPCSQAGGGRGDGPPTGPTAPLPSAPSVDRLKGPNGAGRLGLTMPSPEAWGCPQGRGQCWTPRCSLPRTAARQNQVPSGWAALHPLHKKPGSLSPSPGPLGPGKDCGRVGGSSPQVFVGRTPLCGSGPSLATESPHRASRTGLKQ